MDERSLPKLSQDKDEWVLVLRRVLAHAREEVWSALTEAEQIPDWGPFATDRDLTSGGPVRLAHIDNPAEDARQGYVLESRAPGLLVLRWGDDILRWELTEQGDDTMLELRHRFADRQLAPSYAAGWHLCLEGLTGKLDGRTMPSMVGSNAVHHGYRELYAKYEALWQNPEDERGEEHIHE